MYKNKLTASPVYLKLAILSIPLPYLAMQLGWLVTELGRQPWIVYGLMRTNEGLSGTVTLTQVWVSLGGFIIFYTALGAADIWLLARYAKKGMEA